MKYSIITFGCRVNQADSLAIEETLLAHGAVPTDGGTPDVVIVNTCSVTATADQGARQTIRRIARDHPMARLIVTGCYATRQPDAVRQLSPFVKVVPNSRKDRLLDDLAPELGLATAERFGDGDGPCGAHLRPGTAGRTAYTLRVQTGCTEKCSYCIIPSTRGVGVSLPIANVLESIRRATAAGFKEVVLTGVHLGSYGRDLFPIRSLFDLLQALADEPADVLYRISSLEPMDCNAAIVDLVASSLRFAPHFHLPVQHGDPCVLRTMRRPYTPDYYEKLIEDIHGRLPAAAIGTDVIAGFPGENDEQFERTVRFLDRLPLTQLHVFPYSDRAGTEASRMTTRVDGKRIRERAARLRELSHSLTRRFRERQLGHVRRGLTLDDGTLVVTDNYLKVHIPPGLARNQWVQVRIDSVEGEIRGSLIGDW